MTTGKVVARAAHEFSFALTYCGQVGGGGVFAAVARGGYLKESSGMLNLSRLVSPRWAGTATNLYRPVLQFNTELFFLIE